MRLRLVLQSRPVPPVYRDYTDFLLFLPDVLLLLTLGFWGLDLAISRRGIRFGPLFLALPMVLLLLASLVSALFSLDPALSFYYTLRLALLAGFYLYLVNEIDTLGPLTLALVLGVLLQAVPAIAQALRQASLGLGWLGEYRLDAAWPGVSVITANGARFLRAYGLSDHPNILGGCLAFALLLLAPGLVQEGKSRPLALSAAGIGTLALFFTFSRAAWLALAGGLLMMAVIFAYAKQKQALRDLGLALLALLLLLLPFAWAYAADLVPRLNLDGSFQQASMEAQAVGERALLNSAANTLFASHALQGVGLGTFPQALQRLHPQWPGDYQPAHFVLLDAAAETGIPGALAWTLLSLTPWLALWLRRRRLCFTPDLAAASALLFALTIVGLFDYYPWLLVPGRLWQWLAWGLWGAAYMRARSLSGG